MEEKKGRKNRHTKLIEIFLVLFDIAAVSGSFLFALWIRFDCRMNSIDAVYLDAFKKSILFYALFCVILFSVFKLYRSIWKFASFMELARISLATVIAIAVYVGGMAIWGRRMPVSYYVFGGVCQFTLTTGIRFSYRFVRLLNSLNRKGGDDVKRIMIVGAGDAGGMILRDINSADNKERAVCFIDDDHGKHGRYIDGVKVAGDRHDIPGKVKEYDVDKIYIALPRAKARDRKEILELCTQTGCEIRNLPGIFELRNGAVTVSHLKKVEVEDLLGREPIKISMDDIFRTLTGKVILVTGGGGSIGSELCRQIASHRPRQLVIVDIYENNAYDIQQELKRKHPELDLAVRIGSVRDSRFLFKIFETYRPEYVFHAAAHKHVPLMEDSPCEAIKNNVLGTYKTAYAAMVHGVKRFVLISTDKAVNPTNIMGASKRLCEMVCQAFDHKIKEGKAEEIPQLFTHDGLQITEENRKALENAGTEFVAVRFGNVLGSNGSVIPLFKKQIEQGGPLTVTHPDIIRYFMTIPEAVSLVLEAGTYAHGGEIFVLDMGDPVKIDDLARNLIRLSGLKPDEDIRIVYTGLRPGEKLFEEKLMAEEGLQKTDNDLIHIGKPVEFTISEFLENLGELMETAYRNKNHEVKEKTKQMVSTYHPAE